MKTELGNLDNFDSLLEDLETSGLTYKEMMQQYSLTRWGARRLGDNTVVNSERQGREKIFTLDNAEIARKELKHVEVPVSDEPHHSEATREQSQTKQTRTRKANTYLAQLENEVKNTETSSTEFTPAETRETGTTALIHETDPHFSAQVKDRHGEIIYDTNIAEMKTIEAFDFYIEKILEQQPVDEIVLMLGGDLVEGEDIYGGQAHKIDDTLNQQIRSARKCYMQQIRRLKDWFNVPVKVVCVSGNHGNMNTGSNANADDLIYRMLEDMVNLSELENVKFVYSDRSDYTTFTYRGGKYTGYLTHGENRSHHIGTSSPQSDWLAIKDDIGFDAAWRGHYHNQKQENVNGTPIFMTNSRKPGDDYTDSIATFGQTGNAVYFASDDESVGRVEVETNV